MQKSKPFFSLSYQIIVLIVLLLLLPLCGAGYYFYQSTMSNLHKIEQENAGNSSYSAHMLLNRLGDGLLDSVLTNAHWADFMNAVKNNDIAWVEENVNVSVGIVPNVHFMAAADMNGNIITEKEATEEFKGTLGVPDLLNLLSKKGQHAGLIQTSKGLAVIGASLITDEAGTAPPVGILVFGRILDKGALDTIKEALNADVALLSAKGQLIATSDLIGKDKLAAHLPAVAKDAHYTGYEAVRTDDARMTQVFTPLFDLAGNTAGVMFVGSASQASVQVAGDLLRLSGIVGLILAALLITLTWIIRRRIITPIYRFTGILGEIAAGTLTVRVPERDLARRDEIRTMADAVQRMVLQLRQLLERITDTTHQVTASAEQLSASAAQTTESTQHIAAAMEEVTGGAEAQASGAAQSDASLRGMIGDIGHISATSERMADSFADAMKDAEQGNEAVRQAVKQMNQISATTAGASEVVRLLSERFDKVGQIVASITQIAGQTNLLALNAAIEASRAGEQGKGFAVVAGEVRKLAGQSEDAAQGIVELIEEIQRSAREVSRAVGENSREVEIGMDVVRSAGTAFEAIVAKVREMAEQIGEVKRLADGMSATSGTVQAAARESSRIAQEVYGYTQNVAGITEEQLAVMEEVSASASHLSRMAEDLQKLVDQFKLQG